MKQIQKLKKYRKATGRCEMKKQKVNWKKDKNYLINEDLIMRCTEETIYDQKHNKKNRQQKNMGTPMEIKKKSEKQIRKIHMEGSQEISNICIFNILTLKK